METDFMEAWFYFMGLGLYFMGLGPQKNLKKREKNLPYENLWKLFMKGGLRSQWDETTCKYFVKKGHVMSSQEVI